jgi:hypothetical protein
MPPVFSAGDFGPGGAEQPPLKPAREDSISPDGKYVVYGLRENGGQSLWVRQVATQSQMQIVAPAGSAMSA